MIVGTDWVWFPEDRGITKYWSLSMENKPKNLGRAYLVGKLQAQGLSRRQSVLIMNFILERMIHALRRGWEVEFPLGKLKRVKRHFSKLWDAIDDWPANRDPHTIMHELDAAGDRELHPWAWPKTCTPNARSQRLMNSSSRARRKSMEANAV
jgi:hypothetical protein